jgi:hypothetical protein
MYIKQWAFNGLGVICLIALFHRNKRKTSTLSNFHWRQQPANRAHSCDFITLPDTDPISCVSAVESEDTPAIIIKSMVTDPPYKATSGFSPLFPLPQCIRFFIIYCLGYSMNIHKESQRRRQEIDWDKFGEDIVACVGVLSRPQESDSHREMQVGNLMLYYCLFN